jgi:hypothetical protein
MSLGNVEQNPPAHTQHNEGGGGSNEGNINAAIKQLGMHCNQGGISNRSKPPKSKDRKLYLLFQNKCYSNFLSDKLIPNSILSCGLLIHHNTHIISISLTLLNDSLLCCRSMTLIALQVL